MASKSNKPTWDVDPELLIIEVESRPLLYSKILPEYSNKSLKNDAWEDVAKHLSESWQVLGNEEKKNRCKDVQAKWKHLRDNFRREYQAQRDITSGQGAKKRKKYRYYDQLLFLIPHIKDAKSSGNYDVQETDLGEQNSQLSESHDIDDVANSPTFIPGTTTVQRTANRGQKKKTIFEDEVLKAIRNEAAESDEDRSFCLSLVPSLKKMDDANKLLVKAEILNVIRRFLFPTTQSFSHTYAYHSNHPSFNETNIPLIHTQPYYNQLDCPRNNLHQTPMHTQNNYQSTSTDSILSSKKINVLEDYHISSHPSSTQNSSRPCSTQSYFSNYIPSPTPSPTGTDTSYATRSFVNSPDETTHNTISNVQQNG